MWLNLTLELWQNGVLTFKFLIDYISWNRYFLMLSCHGTKIANQIMEAENNLGSKDIQICATNQRE